MPWSALLLPLIVVLLGLLARRVPLQAPTLREALDSRAAPWLAGLATAMFLAGLWGSLDERGIVHDEAAYLLQARIFASFQLSAPSPPLPEFFEQYHVFVTPRLAPKYPPGHALALVPGVWLGLPGLMPVLLHGIAGGLLFALARRLADGGVALLTWLLWQLAPSLNLARCTYLSQSTSTALWMIGAFLLLRWWEAGRTRDLAGLALALAWMGITRPWTAVAFGAPLGLVVLVGTWRRRAFRPLLLAAATALPVLLVLPVWSQASTGDWRVLPYVEYSRVYFPYEKPGFGEDPAPALRELPPDMRDFDVYYRAVHAAHTLPALPEAFALRLRSAAGELCELPLTWALPLFMAVGLLGLEQRGRLAVGWALAPFVAYLLYAHPATWTIYYHEVQGIGAFVAALGIARSLAWLASGWPRTAAAPRPLAPVVGVALLALASGLSEAVETRAVLQRRLTYHRDFLRVLAAIPESRAMLFVRYGPHHNPNRALIENTPDLTRDRVWVVYDRAEDNLRLLRAAPERTPYLFDEGAWALYRLVPRQGE